MTIASASTGPSAQLIMPEMPDFTSSLTLAWLTALLLGPFIVALALRPWLEAECERRAEKMRSLMAIDYWAFRGLVALTNPGYRASLLVLIYAVALAVLSGAIVWREGNMAYVGGSRVLLVNVTPGLAAAAATLLAPSIALFVAGVAVAIGGQKWSPALRTTPLLPALWMGGLALGGCMAGLAMPSIWVGGVGVAAACVVAGAVVLLAPSDQGNGWRQIARALAAGRADFAVDALRSGPASGEYRAPSTRGVARWFQSWFFIAASVLEHIRWDGNGIEVGWLDGKSERHTWEEVGEIKVTGNIKGRQGAEILMCDGKEIDVPESGTGYRGLVSAIQAHLWEREREQR